MIDLINFVVAVVCAFVLGLSTHSVYLHEKKRHGWKFPWDHDEWAYRCVNCDYVTDSHAEFAYHVCHLDAGTEGTRRES